MVLSSSKWLLAKYLIDAKKCVDSLQYIFQNVELLHTINLRDRCDTLRQKFYISLCDVLSEKVGKQKQELRKNDAIIGRIYYERDKKAAHKDSSYRPRVYESPLEEIEDKKKEILYVRGFCKSVLPDEITLDFVPHDKELFRLVHRLNVDIERDANLIKYPRCVFHSYQLSEEGRHVFRAFDTENQDRETARIFGFDYDKVVERTPLSSVDDLKDMTEDEKRRLAIILENGINIYEGVQNRQDFCIQYNITFNGNLWVTPTANAFKMTEELTEVGFLDAFEIPHLEVLEDESTRIKVNEILRRYNE